MGAPREWVCTHTWVRGLLVQPRGWVGTSSVVIVERNSTRTSRVNTVDNLVNASFCIQSNFVCKHICPDTDVNLCIKQIIPHAQKVALITRSVLKTATLVYKFLTCGYPKYFSTFLSPYHSAYNTRSGRPDRNFLVLPQFRPSIHNSKRHFSHSLPMMFQMCRMICLMRFALLHLLPL